MKYLLLILTLLIPRLSWAGDIEDDYHRLISIPMKYTAVLHPKIIVRSNLKLNKKDRSDASEEFHLIEGYFYEFEDITTCKSEGPLKITIIGSRALNSRVKNITPSEGNVLFGIYFRGIHSMFIVRSSVWRYHEDFAHELAHYFYDICGIHFRNEDLEHSRIKKFQEYIRGKI